MSSFAFRYLRFYSTSFESPCLIHFLLVDIIYQTCILLWIRLVILCPERPSNRITSYLALAYRHVLFLLHVHHPVQQYKRIGKTALLIKPLPLYANDHSYRMLPTWPCVLFPTTHLPPLFIHLK
jgi:hypothetical protein